MKLKNYILGIAVAGGLGMTSCCDLTPKIYSSLTTGNAYSTAAGMQAAVVSLYSDLNPYPGDSWRYYAAYLVTITDYSTGMCYSTAAAPSKMAQLTYDASCIYFDRNWQDMYQVINNANMIITKIDEAVDMSDADKKLCVAQAKFCRALAYHDLTNGWGAVPMVTEPLSIDESYDYPLTEVKTIEDELLIPDLKECIATLPAQWEGIDVARASKGAANMLLGKIYMRRHEYSTAEPYIQAVLSGPYALEDDFREVWSEFNKQSKELIFALLHETGSNGAEIACHFGPQNHPEATGRWAYYGASIGFWKSYDDNDARKYFFYYDYESIQANGNKNMIYSVRGVRPDNDPEIVSGNVKFMDNVTPMKYTYKMISDAYYDGRTVSVFRLSDAYLCMAEIKNNTAGVAAALPYINKIRSRSGHNGADITYGSAGYPVPASVEAMNEAILKERGWEFVEENMNRPDALRLGGYDKQVRELFAANNWPVPANLSDLHLFPYPLKEAQKNKFMEEANKSRMPK